MKTRNYTTFFIMLLLSFFIMYCVMFLNVDSTDHIYLSETRLYMSLLMVSPMALVMLLFMREMYPDKKRNGIIAVSFISVFMLSLACLRTQFPVGDKQYMKAMIPHHSSAIMTSKHADIRDPELKKLSEGIIESQEREIKQMQSILERLDK